MNAGRITVARGLLAGLATVLAVSCAAATVELIAPEKGSVVALVPDAQKKVMSLPTLDERLKLFAEDRKSGKKLRHDPFWRKAKPFVLKWRGTDGAKGPWKVEIGTKADLSDARTWYIRAKKVDAATGRETDADRTKEEVITFEVPCANLEIGRDYYWRVSSRFGKWNCGSTCGPKCGCKESKSMVRSEIATFKTEDLAPRWIAIEGRTGNIRDLGGRRTADGRRVRQGMAFRGQGLNDNSVTAEVQGANRLTVEDVKYFRDVLHIRTDLDLRSQRELADLSVSPLGSEVTLVHRSSSCYAGIFTEGGKKVMAENFRLFCDRKNYPIYFHCIGGADRTGSLAYVLNGVLGVDRHELETDWESTFYPRIPDANPDPNFWCRESHFNNGFSKYGKEGDSWTHRIELYLLDCGVTQEEIVAFREIMLEP